MAGEGSHVVLRHIARNTVVFLVLGGLLPLFWLAGVEVTLWFSI